MKIKYILQLLYCCFYDFKRYFAFHSFPSKNTAPHLSANIIMDVHRLEKGLTMPNVRLGFGKDVIDRLIENKSLYEKMNCCDNNVLDFIISSLTEYDSFHTEKNFSYHREAEVKKIISTSENLLSAGVKPIGDSSDPGAMNFDQLMNARSSVRGYAKEDVPDQALARIADIASRTPSVCNRQHWKIHFLKGDLKDRALILQNGNRGFSEEIPVLAVVTSKLSSFVSPMERYQPFVDGGMFAMNVLNAAYSTGISSCALNWSARVKNDVALRKLGFLDDEESVIMFISMGYRKGQDQLITKSPKLDPSTFFTIHE